MRFLVFPSQGEKRWPSGRRQALEAALKKLKEDKMT
jgi:hypothetical protein